MDPLTAGLLMGGSSIIGNVLSARMTNEANQSMVNQQQNFQETMSNTSYQRAVQDMKLAGINPMLAATNGGASTPSGASLAQTSPDFAGAISTGAETAMAMRAQNTDLGLKNSQIANTDQDTSNKEATKALLINQTKASAQDIKQKAMANEVLSKTLQAQVKKANAEGNYAEINQLMGIINSGANSANALVNPSKLIGPLINKPR